MRSAGPRGANVRVAGSAPLALAGLLLLAPPAAATFAGTNGPIAYVGASAIETAEPDGSNPRTLQRGTNPSWNVTGSTLVYECPQADGHQICSMDADGSDPEQLSVNGGSDPGYSPGGDVVFVREVGGFDQVFTMQDDNGEIGLFQRTSDPRDHSDPTFSATGNPDDGDEVLAYAADGDIWRMELGEDPVNLTHRYSLGAATQPDFSPDGSRIVFAADGKLYEVGYDGTGIRQLTLGTEGPFDGEDSSPVYSPDGEQIAFSRRTPAGTAVLRVDVAGQQPPLVVAQMPDDDDAEPSWAPTTPPLFEVIAKSNVQRADCDQGDAVVGGGHAGMGMDPLDGGAGDTLNDGENPVLPGSWVYSGPAHNEFGFPIATYVVCGPPIYWPAGTGTTVPPIQWLCGADYISAALCWKNTGQGSEEDYHMFNVDLEVDCGGGGQVVSGGTSPFEARSGSSTLGSTPKGSTAWLGRGQLDEEIGGLANYSATALCLPPPVDQNPAIALSSNQTGPFRDPTYTEVLSWYATCPDGSYAIAGGWNFTAATTSIHGGTLIDYYPVTPQPTPYGDLPTAWFFRANPDWRTETPDFSAIAVCAVLPSGLEVPSENGALTFAAAAPDGGPSAVLRSGTPRGRRVDSAAEPRWVPDASGYTFARRRSGNAPKLFLYDDTRDEVRPLGPRGSSAAFGPDLRTFAFARPGRGIFLGSDVEPDTRQLTTARTDRDPAWSPDGERIAFTRGHRGRSAIWTVDEEGEATERLTPRPLSASDPDFSPYGDRLTFSGERDGCRAVYSIRLDESGLERLTACSARAGDPAWSPNGKRIAYATRGESGGAIASIAAAGGPPRIEERSRRRLSDPDWRPYPGATGPVPLEGRGR